MPEPDKKAQDAAEIAALEKMMADNAAADAPPAPREGTPPGATPVAGNPGVYTEQAPAAAKPETPGLLAGITESVTAQTMKKVMEGKGALQTSLEVASNVANEGAKAVARGVVGAAKETAKGALALVGADKAKPVSPEEFNTLSLFQKAAAIPKNAALNAPEAMSELQSAAPADPVMAPATTVVENLSRFATGFFGATKLLKVAGALQGATKAAKFANASTAGALADFFSFGGTEGRLSDLVQEHPGLANPVSEFLASKETDTEVTGRLKNALEGLGIGAVMEGAFLSLARGYKAAKTLHEAGKHAEAVKVLEETQAAVEPAIVQSQGQIGKVRPLPGKEREVADQLRAAGRAKEADEILAGLGEGAGNKVAPEASQAPANASPALNKPSPYASEFAQDAPPVPKDPQERLKQLKEFQEAKVRPAKKGDETTWEGMKSDPNTAAMITKGDPGIEEVTPRRLMANERHFVFRDAAGEPQGALSLYLPTKTDPGFVKVAVNPEATRQGIATKLYQAAEEAGINVEQLSASTRNTLTPEGSAFRQGRLQKKIAEAGTQTSRALPSDDLSGVLKDRLAHPEGKPNELVSGDLINYERIAGPDEVLKAMDDIASANRPELERARGPVETLQEVKDAARDLGLNPEDLVGDLEAYKASSQQARPKILAARQMIRRITEDAQVEAQKLLMQGAGADQSRLKAMFNTTSNLMIAVKGAQAEAARTLGSQRIITEAFTGDLSDQALRMIATMDDPSQLTGMVKKIGKVEATGDMLLQVYFNNILSSFTTHATNLGAGAANSLFVPFSKAVGGAVTADFHSAREGISQFLSTFFVLKDSFKAAGKALKLDSAILDPRSAGLKGTGGAFQEASRAYGLEDSWVHSMAKGLDVVTGVSGRLLTSADELVKQTVARAQIRAKALVDGAEQGLKGQQLADFLDQRMRDAFEPTGALKDKQALYEARVATLTAPLLPGTLGKGIQDLVATNKWLRPMVPFIRVPTNAIRQGFQNNITGIFYKEMREEFAKGGSARALAVGRMTVGTGITAMGSMFALQGKLTGSGPKNVDQRRALEADGWKPNSIVFENADGTKSYVPYDRTDPIFKMWGLVADVYAAQHHLKESDKDNLAGLLVSAAARSVASASYMKSVSDSFDILSGDERSAARFMRNGVVSLVVPFSGAEKNLRAMLDPDLRKVESTLDAIYNSVPGLSDKLPPKRDVLGEPMKAYRTGLGAINPFLYDASNKDPVRRELARLAEDDQFFGMPAEHAGESKTNPIDLTKFKNEKGQSAYDRLLELRGTIKDRHGKTLRETLQDTIDSDKYKNASDGEGGYDGRKKDMLAAVLGNYHNRAMNSHLRKEFPALDEALKQDERNAGASKKGTALTPIALPK